MSGFRALHQARKTGRVVHGDVRENLPVQVDAGALETADKLAVGNGGNAAGSIDTYNPKGTEIPLFKSAAHITVAQRLLDSFLS